MKKRQFLGHLASAGMAMPFLTLPNMVKGAVSDSYPMEEEAFWKRIREDYELKPEYINLENGYYNFIPRPTMNRYIDLIKMINYEASYYMRTVQWENKDKARDRLARFVNCSPEALMLTRNTTESLDLVIGGYPWKSGDEAILAEQDYGSMRDHFKLMEKKYGITNHIVSVPNHPSSDEEIVALYESKITPNTRMIMVSHMINITGQILPIRKICDMAHSHGVEVLVDGAHCVGHIKVDIDALDCDYYGSSLHKWLSVPLGSGMLYVAQKHISKLWPLFADYTDEIPKISRLNHTGTIPVQTDLAIHDALDYLEIMGAERKENRLRFLQFYWTDQLRNEPKILINTPADRNRSCGIANVGLIGTAPIDLASTLLEEFGIFTVGIDSDTVKGCRITPNVYTTTQELDALVQAIRTLADR